MPLEMKMPKMFHTWQYEPKVEGNYVSYYEHWKCRTCGIVSLRNPFTYPGHIVDLEKAHIERIKKQRKKKL